MYNFFNLLHITEKTKEWTSLQNWSESSKCGSDCHSFTTPYNEVMFTLDRSLHILVKIT